MRSWLKLSRAQVNMTVFGDRADEVRKEIRRQVEAREGVYAKLRD